MERFLTAEQVAELLQVHLDTVRRWLREGTLHGRKIGRVWRVPESELDNLKKAVANDSQKEQEDE